MSPDPVDRPTRSTQPPFQLPSANRPPLLQTYNAPSGPTAAPLGPPPHVATTSFPPSGPTRVTRPASISVTNTLPSAQATGPSGNDRPSATTVTSSRMTVETAGPVGTTSGPWDDPDVHGLVRADQGPEPLLGPVDRIGVAGKGLEGPPRR